MEIKKILTALSAAAIILSAAVIGYAADEVIFEGGRTEAADTFVDLDGWGEELFTKAIFEADVQFKDVDSGITLRNADNTKGGTSICAAMKGDVLTMAAYGGVEGNYIFYNPIDTEATYHIKLIGTYGVANGMIDMVAEKLDENGNAVETKNAYLILMNEMYASSNVGPEHIRVEANTVVDNVKVTVLKPDELEFVSPPETVTANSSTELKAKFIREGEELEYAAPITYTTDGDGVSISSEGILTVEQDAPEQEFTVTAASGDMTASTKMQVVSSDIFTINTALISEDGKALEAVNAVKNYFYNGNAVFVVTAYDENGILRDSFTKTVNAKAIPTKTDTYVISGCTLPEEFDSETWTIEINAYSASDTADIPEVSGDIPVRAFFEENGGAVEWIGEHSVITGMLNGKTAVMQTGSSEIFVDSVKHILSAATYIADDWRAYISGEIADILR